MHFKDLFSKQCLLGIIGVCMAGFGAVFAWMWIDLFESKLHMEMLLANNTKSYEVWKTPPIPMNFDIYFYNWTNPCNFTKDEFVKPILEQIGPYRFTEIMDKVDLEWHPENSTVSYRKKSTYYFDAAASNGSLDDTITTLNIIALAAATKASTWSYMNQKAVSMGLIMYDQKVYVSKPARELLFEGYQDDMIDVAIDTPSIVKGEEVTVPYDRFGWFYMRNGTSNQTGHYNINTGATDFSKIGQVEFWDYSNRTKFFPDHCGMINGSAGEFYPPNETKDKPVTFYSPDMCRSIDFDFEKEVEIHGVKGYKYSGGKKTVDNGTEYPENKCYSGGNMVPSGVMNVSSCRYGTPVFMSFPHYYAADPYYLDMVDGLSPSQEKHEFSITLEPKTGIPMEVAARFQINMLVKPIPNIGLYQEAPTLFFPVLWFEQRVSLGEDMAGEIYLITVIPMAGYFCCGLLILLGVIMVVWVPIARLCGCGRSQSSDISPSSVSKKAVLPIPEGSPLMGTKKNGLPTLVINEKDTQKNRPDESPMIHTFQKNGSSIADKVKTTENA